MKNSNSSVETLAKDDNLKSLYNILEKYCISYLNSYCRITFTKEARQRKVLVQSILKKCHKLISYYPNNKSNLEINSNLIEHQQSNNNDLKTNILDKQKDTSERRCIEPLLDPPFTPTLNNVYQELSPKNSLLKDPKSTDFSIKKPIPKAHISRSLHKIINKFDRTNPKKIRLKYFNKLIGDLTNILNNEPNIVNITGPVMVVGDIHGDLKSLMHCVQTFLKRNTSILFLGDYTDRGQKGIECLTLLSVLKKNFPDKVFLLRGNHENLKMNSQNHGLAHEIDGKYTLTEGQNFETFKSLKEFHKSLPIAAIINNKYFCAHSGIGEDVNKNAIASLDRKHENIKSNTMRQMLWNDPLPQDHESYNAQEAIFLKNTKNKSRPYFNKGALDNFLKDVGCSIMIRGHQAPKTNGYKKDFDGKLFTIFSSKAQAKQTAYIQINKNNDLKVVPISN